MKHRMMIRSLALILAGVMLAGSSIPSFAKEADDSISEAAVSVDLPVDGDETEKELDETDILTDNEPGTEKVLDEEQKLEGAESNGQQSEEQKPEGAALPDVETELEEEPDKKQNLEGEPSDEYGDEVQEDLLDTDVNVVEEETPVLEAPAVARVFLDQDKIVLPLHGGTGTLTARAYDEAGKEIETGGIFSWSTTEGGQVIAVDVDGPTAVITPKTVGNAKVEVRAGGKAATCDVEVVIPISSVSLDKTSLSMKKKQVTKLAETVLPSDTTIDKTCKWSSSNTNVARVDDNGQVTAVAFGTANITVETVDGHTAVCQITVLDEEWRTGWHLINNNWYYYNEESVIQTGWQKIDGKYYYLDNNGAMQKGWLYSGGKWYYLNTGGDRRSGWLDLNKKWYYLDQNGVMQTGMAKADGHVFYFNGSGEMQTGWQKVSNKWYYFDYSSGAQISWKKINNKWYYFNIDGEMQTGWQKVDNIWYYMDGSGAMQTGWQKISNKWYYLSGNGAMQTGWQKISNKWYYLSGSGAMQTGWHVINNVWYYMNGSGVMQTGWQKISNKWYYLGSNGAMRTDWEKISNKWYYFNRNGAMQTGWQKISNKWYYLSGSGAMQTGWIKINGKHYYLNTSGVMQTGWQPIGGSWYYLNTDGSMKTGWQKSGNNWYYLKSNGSMATSDTMIDGKNNGFDSTGIWQGVIETKIRAYGIDVSSHQGDIDWKKVAKDDIDFAMLRVVSGKGSGMARDSRFKEYYDGARDAGIKVGAYKYCYAESRTQARREADAVIEALNGRKLDYPVVLDVEEEDGIMSSSISNARRTEIILAFKEKIENAGYKFALYASYSDLNKKLEASLLKDVDIWVARWRDLDRGHGYSGDGNVTMWQYSNKGSVNGISGNVDLDVSYKKY